MTEFPVIPDTSAWIHFFRDENSPAGCEVQRLVRADLAVTIPPVVLEVCAGARSNDELKGLRQRFGLLRQLRLEADDWAAAADHSLALRSSGVTVPLADVLIATITITSGLELIHDDRHFEMMAEVLPLRQRRAGGPPGQVR